MVSKTVAKKYAKLGQFTVKQLKEKIKKYDNHKPFSQMGTKRKMIVELERLERSGKKQSNKWSILIVLLALLVIYILLRHLCDI